MEKTIDFEVKEKSIQEFADKYFIDAERLMEGSGRKEPINPYYLLGRKEVFVRKEIMDIVENDPTIRFTLSDESRNTRTRLRNIYQYSIEKYDDVLLKLVLIDFVVEIDK